MTYVLGGMSIRFLGYQRNYYYMPFEDCSPKHAKKKKYENTYFLIVNIFFSNSSSKVLTVKKDEQRVNINIFLSHNGNGGQEDTSSEFDCPSEIQMVRFKKKDTLII